MKKVLGNILFWATLVSPMVSFCLASLIGEANIFDVAGIVRYSWIMLLFVPIGILSIIIGLSLKNNNQKHKKNLVVAYICLPLLIIFGSFRFIFVDVVSYDTNEISMVEEKVNLELPNEIKSATIKLDLYNLRYSKIIDNECKEAFEREINSNHLWQNSLSPEIKKVLPLDIQYKSDAYDYFVFYNLTHDEYNVVSQNGECECVFIAYDSDLRRLFILDDYKISMN